MAGGVLLGSATLSSASPAVEMTLAVVEASYVFVMPGVNAPNEAGVPSVSDSVAGTVPPTAPDVARPAATLSPLTAKALTVPGRWRRWRP